METFSAFSFGEALFIGILYWLSYLDAEFSWWVGDPLLLGLLFGTMYGNVDQGLQLGAQIMLLYIANVAVGANLPADNILAAMIAIPIALKAGMTTEMAIAIAVPFGIIGTTADNARRLINGMWNRRAFVHADQLNYKGLLVDAVFGPMAVQFPLRVIPVTAIMFLGGAAAPRILDLLPEWVSHGLGVVGGLLPALGFVRCVLMIGRKNLLPYFVFGFFIMLLGEGKIALLLVGVFGGCLAVLHVQFAQILPKNF